MEISVLSQKFKVAQDTVVRKENFGALAIKRGNTNIFALNDTGYLIMLYCNGSKTVTEVIDEMDRCYNASREEIEKTVVDFIQAVAQAGFLEGVDE